MKMRKLTSFFAPQLFFERALWPVGMHDLPSGKRRKCKSDRRNHSTPAPIASDTCFGKTISGWQGGKVFELIGGLKIQRSLVSVCLFQWMAGCSPFGSLFPSVSLRPTHEEELLEKLAPSQLEKK